MKNGNKLENIYTLAQDYETVNITRQSNEEVRWITIFEKKELNVRLGISKTGKWVYEEKQVFYILNNKRDYLYCAKLLEIPYYLVHSKIQNQLKSFFAKEKVDVREVFPFYEIVEFAFINLLDDYWFELALDWYKELPREEKYQLVGLIESITKNSRLSQKNRHKAKREIKNSLEFFPN